MIPEDTMPTCEDINVSLETILQEFLKSGTQGLLCKMMKASLRDVYEEVGRIQGE